MNLEAVVNLSTVALGSVACAYAIGVLALRLAGRERYFRKLVPMRQQWGSRTGSALHYASYVVVPFVVGATVIAAGLSGISLIDLFTK